MGSKKGKIDYPTAQFFGISYKLRKRPVLNIAVEIIVTSLSAFAIYMFFKYGKNNIPLSNVFSITLNLFSMLVLCILGFILLFDRTPPDESTMYFHLFGICACFGAFGDAISCIVNGIPSFSYLQTIACYISYISTPCLCLAIYCYENSLCKEDFLFKKRFLRLAFLFFFVDIIFIALNFAFGYAFTINEMGEYTSGNLVFLFLIYPLIILLLLLFGICVHKKHKGKELLALISFFLTLITMSVFWLFNIGIDFVFAIATLVQLILFGVVHLSRSEEIARKKEELLHKEQQLMVSQINPHFIYNTLTTIGYLCKTDPELAEKVVYLFAKYLRMNIDSLSRVEKIPFEKELEHINCYLTIQQLRFPSIHVEYDIKDKSFFLPMLTIQPMVENAVRYGIKGQKDGFVKISSELIDGFHVVTITDNGCGFDINNYENNNDKSRGHFGISNAKSRLKSISNGTLEITSEIGKGTVAKIKIPA